MRENAEVARNQQSREISRLPFRLKIILAIAVLGLAASAISGYTIYDRNRFFPASTPTRTLAFTPTPMYPFPPDIKSCKSIPPDQQDYYTEPYQGGIRVTGDKIYEYLVGRPDKGKFQVLYPGQQFPSDFDGQKDQFWFCRRTFAPASPTPK